MCNCQNSLKIVHCWLILANFNITDLGPIGTLNLKVETKLKLFQGTLSLFCSLKMSSETRKKDRRETHQK